MGTYKEECAASSRRVGQLHADTERAQSRVVAHADDFGAAHKAIGVVASNPQLEPGIATVLGVSRPGIVVLERVGQDVAHFHGLAVGASGVLGRDIVLLGSPANL